MAAGEADPWSGDDVPVSSALGEIVWDSVPGGDGEVPSTDSDDADEISRRRLILPMAAIAAVTIVGLGTFVWPDQAEPAADVPASSVSVSPTTLDTLPPVIADAPTTAADAPDDSESTAIPERRVLNELPAGDLPASIASAELTTAVVVVTSDGELVTLELPSGDITERVDLGLGRTAQIDTGIIVLSPDAAMYATDTSVLVVATGQVPVSVEREEFARNGDQNPVRIIPFGWTTDVDGTNVFVVISFDGTGQQLEWLVTNQGDVTPAPAQRAGTFARPLFSSGTRFIDDAGGAYRVDPNGASTRISTGQVLATSETRLLLRECDANRICNAVLRSYDGLEVRRVNLPTTFQPRFFAASLSPDDTAATFIDSNFNGNRTIIDFDSGETLEFPGQVLSEISSPSWSAESSGIFSFGTAAGIRFLERSSGEEFSFATDLGQVRALATRSVPS